MYRKMFAGMICLMLLGIFSVPKSRADEWDKMTIVTVSQPIQVPGKVLPAGTYVFHPNCHSASGARQYGRHFIRVLRQLTQYWGWVLLPCQGMD
jgi:hypothetical protein